MKKLGPPHSHYLSAAEGWIGLGNLAEAREELMHLPTRLRAHPQALELFWTIFAQERDWMAAQEFARMLVAKAPELLSGWIHLGYSIRRALDGGLQPAWDALFPAMEKFPDEAIIPYNLACYACQLQQPDKARILLKRAMSLGGRDQIKKMALNDPDLKPLWKQMDKI
jgi:hypothetical protein